MTLMLVDSASLYFRAFHGVPTAVRAPDGMPVNAVRGFLDMIAQLLSRRRPSRFVACLDHDWRPSFRVELLPSYKAHRLAPDGGETIPDELGPQVPVLLDVLDAVGLSAVGADGFEADDVIATLAARESGPVDVVSGDRDLMALVTESVTLLYTGRGVARLEELGPTQVRERYGVPASRYADFAVLRGDPSDGLPGVKGIGEKAASALVNRFGSVEDIVEAATKDDEGFPAGARSKILAAVDYLAAAPAVVRGRTDIALGPVADTIPSTPADPQRLVELCDRYGLDSPVNRLLAALPAQD